MPAERNKTLTALSNTEPVVEVQRKEAQSLQWFLCESRWDHEELNRRRVEILLEDTATAPNERGALEGLEPLAELFGQELEESE